MLRVESDKTITTYSKKYYYIEYKECGTGELKCKQSDKQISYVIPLRIEKVCGTNIDVFKEGLI
jgi:hypothetical protein